MRTSTKLRRGNSNVDPSTIDIITENEQIEDSRNGDANDKQLVVGRLQTYFDNQAYDIEWITFVKENDYKMSIYYNPLENRGNETVKGKASGRLQIELIKNKVFYRIHEPHFKVLGITYESNISEPQEIAINEIDHQHIKATELFNEFLSKMNQWENL